MKKRFFVLFLYGLCFASPVKNTFNVEGMMCGYGCVSKINSVVTDLKGVKECNVDFENNIMEVVFDNTSINAQTIIKSLPNPYIVTFLSESFSKTYNVEGITCMGCVNSINQALSKVPGILSYVVSLEEGKMIIEFIAEKFDEKKMISFIPEKFKVVALIEEDLNKDEKE